MNLKNYKKITTAILTLAMVVGSVAPFGAKAATTAELQAQIAALMAQLAAMQGGTTTATYTFTTNLTIGSTGPAVVALQDFLISKGYLVMPAGVAKGYFGALTRSALARFQAANGIAPAVGYFGPITRAKVNSMVVVTPGGPVVVVPGTPTTPPTQEGREASLENYDLQGEESRGYEGEENVEIATIEFDVEDGDARVERIEIDFQAENTSDSVRPWDYFESISLWVDGKRLGEMDVDNRRDWRENDANSDHTASSARWYRITFTGLNHDVRRGQTAEIVIKANIARTIDSADLTQEFTVLIPDRGIRARDALGIQHYVGDYDEVVDNFGFGAEQSGNLDINSHREDPNSMILIADERNESDEYTVFVFEIENKDSVDALIKEMIIDATVTGSTLAAVVDEAYLIVGRDKFKGDINGSTLSFDDMDAEIEGDESVKFELQVILKRNAPGATIEFRLDSTNVEAEGVASGDDSNVSGSVSSEQHTIAFIGINVAGKSKSAIVGSNDEVGTFTISFTIEALGDDVYIYNGTGDAGFDSNIGMVYTIYKGGVAMATTTDDSAVLQSSADVSGSWFVIREGKTEDFTLTVSLSPDGDTSALYSVELDSIKFDDDADTTDDDIVYVLPNTSEFETSPIVLK